MLFDYEETLKLEFICSFEDEEYEFNFYKHITGKIKKLVGQCDQCGEWFETAQPRKRFCCDNCRWKYHRENKRGKHIRYCAYCNKRFHTKYHKKIYCSDNCRAYASYHRNK